MKTPFFTLSTSIWWPADPFSDGILAANVCSCVSNWPTVADPVQDIRAPLTYMVVFWPKCPDAPDWLQPDSQDPRRSSCTSVMVVDDLGPNPHDLVSDRRL